MEHAKIDATRDNDLRQPQQSDAFKPLGAAIVDERALVNDEHAIAVPRDRENGFPSVGDRMDDLPAKLQ